MITQRANSIISLKLAYVKYTAVQWKQKFELRKDFNQWQMCFIPCLKFRSDDRCLKKAITTSSLFLPTKGPKMTVRQLKWHVFGQAVAVFLWKKRGKNVRIQFLPKSTSNKCFNVFLIMVVSDELVCNIKHLCKEILRKVVFLKIPRKIVHQVLG